MIETYLMRLKRIYWNEQFDFHLDQILERGYEIKKPRLFMQLGLDLFL